MNMKRFSEQEIINHAASDDVAEDCGFDEAAAARYILSFLSDDDHSSINNLLKHTLFRIEFIDSNAAYVAYWLSESIAIMYSREYKGWSINIDGEVYYP